MEQIGFIGLGIMGRPMAENLIRAGFSVMVYNRSRPAMDSLAKKGAVLAQDVAQLAAQCAVIITMLPDAPDVESVALGPHGIAAHAQPGTLLIDMSSIAPQCSRNIAAALEKNKIRMLDAPVSGGEPKAAEGTLAIMAGGAKQDFEAAKPIFDVLGASARHVGAIGSGNVCKLANQVIVAANIAALAEGLMLAKKAGADPQAVWEAIQSGLAGSAVMHAKAPMMLAGDTAPGFKIALHAKDLAHALETGAKTGSPLPLTAQVQQMLRLLCAKGDAGQDHSALIHYYEHLAGEVLSAGQ